MWEKGDGGDIEASSLWENVLSLIITMAWTVMLPVCCMTVPLS